MTVLSIGAGDTVRAEFPHSLRILHPDPITVRVTEVKTRLGRVNGGTDRMLPLIIGVNTETGEREAFDQSYVAEVLERYPFVRRPKNIYAPHARQLREYVAMSGSPKWCAPLADLASLAMAGLPFEIDRPINAHRLHDLYEKDRMGLVSRDEYFYTVNPKRFKPWVRKHWSSIVETVAETTAWQTKMNTEDEEYSEWMMERTLAGLFDPFAREKLDARFRDDYYRGLDADEAAMDDRDDQEDLDDPPDDSSYVLGDYDF